MPPVGRGCGPCEGKIWALCVTGGRLFVHPPSSDRADERVSSAGLLSDVDCVSEALRVVWADQAGVEDRADVGERALPAGLDERSTSW
jgi:hypothetical protein